MSNKIEGAVAALSPDGDLITDIGEEALKDVPRDQSVTVTCDGYDTQGIYPVDHEQPIGTMVAFMGPQELRMAIVGVSISEMLGIKVGAPVMIQW
ncbi:adenosylmethionine-8-amino-7-oxononanoate aminotransferase [Lignipirellula cremea]|uniref:Adenosylmethionine-8-amino-7-oxononanoate aminotransferase n=1 Tax=Lignipirellula cremea TaxID=2528010 RepID=A0A518DQ28_9BACT|nr:adenosylmethionine-8-amino-7-oxononanoate aminotransferase [Lignipirellula cremea]QDU93938.1 hypothetical protein Pla8534_17240 [Lignipirellula cremea]